MNNIGHNLPPSSIEFSQETLAALTAWLTEHPVIQNEDEAREGKLLDDRTLACLMDMDAERKQQVKPLNDEVKAINDRYREPASTLDRVMQMLRKRLDDYRRAEEAKRAEIARKAREAAEEAERKARELEAREAAALEEAEAGVVVDVTSTTIAADKAFAEAQRMARAAALAEKEQAVKIGGGFRRALSARSHETLVVNDGYAAINEIGWTEDILAAIIKAARVYRQTHERLPNGVVSQKERRI